MTIENIKELMDGVDIAALLPDLQAVLDHAAEIARFLILLGPLVLLFLGLHYYLLAPKEANFTTGYRFFWGMGSVQAWQFTQRLAGTVWGVLGIVLLIAMGLRSLRFSRLDLESLLWEAVRCIGFQMILVLVSCGIINLIVFSRFDRKGNRRLTWGELFRS